MPIRRARRKPHADETTLRFTGTHDPPRALLTVWRPGYARAASNGGLETEGAKAPRCEEGRRAERKDPYRALRDLDEFDNIKPALAALVFGDEGLRTAQPFGNIYLGELPGFPNASEQLLQSLLPWGAERLGHENRLFDEVGSSNNPDFGYPC
jgi:hypothetical protein